MSLGSNQRNSMCSAVNFMWPPWVILEPVAWACDRVSEYMYLAFKGVNWSYHRMMCNIKEGCYKPRLHVCQLCRCRRCHTTMSKTPWGIQFMGFLFFLFGYEAPLMHLWLARARLKISMQSLRHRLCWIHNTASADTNTLQPASTLWSVDWRSVLCMTNNFDRFVFVTQLIPNFYVTLYSRLFGINFNSCSFYSLSWLANVVKRTSKRHC